VNTTMEILSIDGVVLNTLAKNIESIAGRLHVAPKRGANPTISGKPGALWVPGKLDEPNVLALPMWVRGCDDNGAIPVGGSARQQFFDNLDQLTRLFGKSTGLLDVRHTLPNASIRQCFAEMLDEIDFTTSGPNPLGKYSVSLQVPDVYWQDLNQLVQNKVVGATGTTLTFDTFNGGTAPIFDSVITITGPFTTITLQDVPSGDTVTIGTPIAGGTTAVIDNANMTVMNGATDLLTNTSHTGDYFLVLNPGSTTGQHQILVTGAGFTGATAVQVTGRRKFRAG
jgi:hypothetical protein